MALTVGFEILGSKQNKTVLTLQSTYCEKLIAVFKNVAQPDNPVESVTSMTTLSESAKRLRFTIFSKLSGKSRESESRRCLNAHCRDHIDQHRKIGVMQMVEMWGLSWPWALNCASEARQSS